MNQPINLLKTFFRSPSIVRSDPLAARLWKPLRLLIFLIIAFRVLRSLLFRSILTAGVITPARQAAAVITSNALSVFWLLFLAFGIVWYSRWAYKRLFLNNSDLAVTLINKRRWLEAFLTPAFCLFILWIVLGLALQLLRLLYNPIPSGQYLTTVLNISIYYLQKTIYVIYFMFVFSLISMRLLMKEYHGTSTKKFIWTPFIIFVLCFLVGNYSFYIFHHIATLLTPTPSNPNRILVSANVNRALTPSAFKKAAYANLVFQMTIPIVAIIILAKTSKKELLTAEKTLFEAPE